MKSRFTKIAAAALAMTMCVPSAAFAASATPPAPTSGNFTTSFDVYSPTLTVSVPVNLDVKVNPIADSTSTGVGKYTVASNSIDILNASVDVEADKAIPITATIKAGIASSGEGVMTEYNTLAANKTSTNKKIHLELAEAATAAVVDVKSGGTAAFDNDKKLDLTQYAEKTAAVYDGYTNKAMVTKYGSLLSMDIAGPSTADTTNTGATFSTTASDVTPAVGSFAVVGEAYTNADWKADDVKVDITYNVKASQPLAITTPAVATAPTFTSGSDVSITVPSIGESTVVAIAAHNDELYGDHIWEKDAFEVDYTTTAGSAVIKIPKEDAALALLAESDKGNAQDLIIALSDGRMVVTTLTAN